MLRLHANYTKEHGVQWTRALCSDTSADGKSDESAAVWTGSRSVQLRNSGGLWKDYDRVELTLSSAILPASVKSSGPQEQEPKYALNEQLLQSALQKAVRRSKPDIAVRAAATLAQQNAGRFLRRLVVILVEDAYMHKYVQGVVWLMVAVTLGYVWTDAHRERCLSLVHWAARQQKIEHLHAETTDEHWSPLNADGYVLALAVRISYGGMRGDMALLWRFVCRWSHRIATNAAEKIDCTVLEPLSTRATLFVSHSELPCECVDFHVARDNYMALLKKEMQNRALPYDKQKAQDALWHHRSGVYVNKFYVPDGIAWHDQVQSDLRWTLSRPYYENVLAHVLDVVDGFYLSQPLQALSKREKEGASGTSRKRSKKDTDSQSGSILQFFRVLKSCN